MLFRSRGSGTGDGFGQRKKLVILALAEVVPQEQFLEADNPGAAAGGLADPLNGVLKVGGGIGTDPLLNQADADGTGGGTHAGKYHDGRPEGAGMIMSGADCCGGLLIVWGGRAYTWG